MSNITDDAPRRLPHGLISFGPDANCTLELCPPSASAYGYRPILGVNILFIAIYAVAMAIHVFLGIRWKSWWFMVFMLLGCLVEIIGYVGRIMAFYNPFSFGSFMMQIVCITTGPVFYTAAIYITLCKAIESFAPDISRIPPRLFYWIFIPADIVCLILQGSGGALSTKTSGASQVGVKLALAGLSLQVIIIVVFCLLFLDYLARYFRSGRVEVVNRRLKFFFGFLAAAIVLILARCCYRVYELNAGYSSESFRNENLFIGLEGVMIAVSVFALCIGHPGLVFKGESTLSGKASSVESGFMTETKQ